VDNPVTVSVPDIGDFADVEIIEVLIHVGDNVKVEDSLITVESDKASIEIPSPVDGEVTEILVSVGDRISQGTAIAVISADATDAAPAAASQAASAPAAAASPAASNTADGTYDVVVIGAGPGGYTAAFRAADLGLSVLLVERFAELGGVCLNVGCIPSKALLHTAQVINETREMKDHGITFGEPQIDLDKLRGFKEKVIGQLTGGLKGLAKQRSVEVATGVATFQTSTQLNIDNNGSVRTVNFANAIIAAGSSVVKLPGFPYDDDRLIDSTGALELSDIPERLLVVGGGIIGLEMSCVYQALGSKITVVELSDGLIPGCDRDLVRPFQKRVSKLFENIYTSTRVTKMESAAQGINVSFEGKDAPATDTFDKVLLAIGRSPNGKMVSAENAGVEVDERGFIKVDKQQRTNVANIFAIGDLTGQPMLAHKATHEGKVAAEVISGKKSFFDAKTIPSVAYTDPEIAWMGLTEIEAKEKGIAYEKGAFPWAASGRALSIARTEGTTKVLLDPTTKRILGAGMVGTNAGELLAEAVLALEMGADIEDIALTVHPHPTLSETLNFACEVAEGTCTDIYAPKSK